MCLIEVYKNNFCYAQISQNKKAVSVFSSLFRFLSVYATMGILPSWNTVRWKMTLKFVIYAVCNAIVFEIPGRSKHICIRIWKPKSTECGGPQGCGLRNRAACPALPQPQEKILMAWCPLARGIWQRANVHKTHFSFVSLHACSRTETPHLESPRPQFLCFFVCLFCFVF